MATTTTYTITRRSHYRHAGAPGYYATDAGHEVTYMLCGPGRVGQLCVRRGGEYLYVLCDREPGWDYAPIIAACEAFDRGDRGDAYHDPWPDDSYEDDHPGAQDRWRDRLVLRRLVGAEPPPLPPQVRTALGSHVRGDYAGPPWTKRAEKAAAETPEPGAKEPAVTLAGVRLSWHYALPELKIWAGQATLASLIDGRRAAIDAAVWPAGVRLLDWSIPYPTMSGLDPRTAATALDIGFSPAALGMPVACYAAAELLMCLGMQLAPVTRFGPREYGHTDADGRWWRYSVVEREGYHRMLTMARPVRGQVACLLPT